MLLRHPLIGHRTIALIHWHALRLWLRGAPFLRHGAPDARDAGPSDEPGAGPGARSRSPRTAWWNAPRSGSCWRPRRRIRVGRLVVVSPDGRRRAFGDPASEHVGEMRVHHRSAILRMLTGGDTGAGEAYMDGLWSSPDLPALLRVAALNREALALARGWWRLPVRLQRTLAHRARRNTLGGSRRNIEAHYDLGNDFYRLFLDETMTYSSAVFADPEQALADAQRNKYAVIAARAGLRGGEHVLEIGSGWGGFALYAAGELGCRVTTITISPAQHGSRRSAWPPPAWRTA